MEVFVRTKCQLPDTETTHWVKQMLSEDPPLFDDELPEKYIPIFQAFEDSVPPDKSRFSGKGVLNLEWTLNSSWIDDVRPLLVNLAKIQGVATYTCAAADDDIILVEGDRYSALIDGNDLAHKAGIKIDSGTTWVNKLLKYLGTNSVQPNNGK